MGCKALASAHARRIMRKFCATQKSAHHRQTRPSRPLDAPSGEMTGDVAGIESRPDEPADPVVRLADAGDGATPSAAS